MDRLLPQLTVGHPNRAGTRFPARRFTRIVLLAPVAIALVWLAASQAGGPTGEPRPELPPADLRLLDGAPSVDALVARFLAALRDRDRVGLERLRVTECEYLGLIVPGNVPPGAPLQRIPADKAQYFWETLDGKSRYSVQHLLAEYGGRSYTLDKIDFAKGTSHYAWFDAYQQLRLQVKDEAGGAREIGTGSVVAVDGRFKFVSFLRD